MKTFLRTLFIGLFLSPAFLLNAQTISTVFTTSGVFEVPAGVTEITVEAWGAGGGGALNAMDAKGGGAGGSYAKSTLAVTPGAMIPFTVGVGGANGVAGTNSTWNVSTVIATGGEAGLGTSGGGFGGGSTGDIFYSGGNGADASGNNGGGGGGSASSGGSGGWAVGTAGGIGTGNGGGGGIGNNDGANGSAPGGGGGGKGGPDAGSSSGAGANGQIIVTYLNPLCASLTLAEGDVIQPQCLGGADGFVSVVVTGGTPTYLFSWEGHMSTDSVRTGLVAGMYKVYVEDAINCIDSLTFNLGEPSQILITPDDIINETCPDAADGSIEVTATGGTVPISYLWSNGGTGNLIEDLTAGMYTVTATDDNGCMAEETYEVETNNQNPVVTCPSPDTIVRCSWVEIDLDILGFSPSGGTYVINGTSNGSIFNSADQNSGFNDIWYVYTDPITGCTDSCLFVIFVASNPEVTASSNSPVCEGHTIQLMAMGDEGMPPYTFEWEGPDDFTSSDQNPGLTATAASYGDYMVTMTDGNGCMAMSMVTVEEQEEDCIDITIVDPCSCDDPLNIHPPGGEVELFHDVLTVTTGVIGQLVTLQSGDANFVDSDGIQVPDDVEFTEGPPGVYTYSFYRPPATAFTVTVNAGGIMEMFTSELCLDADECGIIPIPTMSEWGLIILSMLMMIGALLYIRQRNNVLSLK